MLATKIIPIWQSGPWLLIYSFSQILWYISQIKIEIFKTAVLVQPSHHCVTCAHQEKAINILSSAIWTCQCDLAHLFITVTMWPVHVPMGLTGVSSLASFDWRGFGCCLDETKGYGNDITGTYNCWHAYVINVCHGFLRGLNEQFFTNVI